MARLSVGSENAGGAAMFASATTYWLALFTADPAQSGTSGEVTGGSYARQAITFTAWAAGTSLSAGTSASQSFTNVPTEAGGIPYFGIFNASSGTGAGTAYLGGGTTSGLSGSIPSGATVSFASGAVSLALS